MDGIQLFLRRYEATHGVIGAQRVEGVGPTHKKAAMLIQQYLHIVTALLLERRRQKRRDKNKERFMRKANLDVMDETTCRQIFKHGHFFSCKFSCFLNAWTGRKVGLTVQLHHRAHDQSNQQ